MCEWLQIYLWIVEIMHQRDKDWCKICWFWKEGGELVQKIFCKKFKMLIWTGVWLGSLIKVYLASRNGQKYYYWCHQICSYHSVAVGVHFVGHLMMQEFCGLIFSGRSVVYFFSVERHVFSWEMLGCFQFILVSWEKYLFPGVRKS